jgi:hypothetical protein
MLMVTVAVVVGVPAGALAEPTFKTDVTIDYQPSSQAFHGKVKSGKGACEPNRKVTLWYKHSQKQGKVVVGTTKTNGQGAWDVDDPFAGLETYYFATAKSRSIDAGTCEAGRSKTLLNPAGR